MPELKRKENRSIKVMLFTMVRLKKNSMANLIRKRYTGNFP